MTGGTRTFLVIMGVIVILVGILQGGMAYYALQQAQSNTGRMGAMMPGGPMGMTPPAATPGAAPMPGAIPGPMAGVIAPLLGWLSYIVLLQWIIAGLVVGAVLFGLAKMLSLLDRQLAAQAAMGSQAMAERRGQRAA